MKQCPAQEIKMLRKVRARNLRAAKKAGDTDNWKEPHPAYQARRV